MKNLTKLLLFVLILAPMHFAEAVTPRKDLVIADLGQPQTNPWVINRHRFQECVARALNIKQILADDENMESKHVSQAESLISRQPDALVFNPLTSPAGAQVARLLERNRIPGMTAGRVVVADYDKEYKGQFLIGQMGTNLEAWGAAMAQAAIDAGHRKIAMIWNPKDVITTQYIWAGAQAVIDKTPGAKVIIEGRDRLSRETGIKYAEQYVARFNKGELDAIIVLGATAGLGTQFALEQAGRTEVDVITCDIDEQVAQHIRDGKLSFSIGGHWMGGGFALIHLYDYLHGFPIEDTQPDFSLIPVTAKTVDAYERQFLDSCVLTPNEIRNLSRVYNPDADLPGFIENFAKTWNQ
ncbi:MAG: substrate-binding domain-containing protein [SAR324 cluster bacterium]|nr:substrate-binding domain-containing protein [SAR324 cluster bacterium]